MDFLGNLPFFNQRALEELLGRRAAPFPAAAQQQPNIPEERRPAPPAGRRAVRQLPTVVVAPEDLVDPSNRECCICLEENHLKERVTRLPCAHIFHQQCIVDWLNKSCTCPVCRYELPTDDAAYERTREERMRTRKPRFAMYELQRMSPRELQELCQRLRIQTRGSVEKQELVDQLVESGKIDVISAPEPVEYPLSLLRAMGVGELRRCMADAGVFFDPKDVVEKEDMVVIFVNSGRLVILPEEETMSDAEIPTMDESPCQKRPAEDVRPSEDDRKSPASGIPVVTTVGEDSDDDETDANGQHGRGRMALPPLSHPLMEEVVPFPSEGMEEETSSAQENAVAGRSRVHHREGRFVSLDDDSLAENADEASSVPGNDRSLDDTVEGAGPLPAAQVPSESHDVALNENAMKVDASVEEVDKRMVDGSSVSGPEPPSALAGVTSDAVEESMHEHEDDGQLDGSEEDVENQPMQERISVEETHVQFDDADEGVSSAIQGHVVAPDTAGDAEMQEAVENAETASRSFAARHASTGCDEYGSSSASEHSFQQRSISDLQALARELHVDISDCIERGEIIQKLTGRARPQPEPADFSNWSVSELRALAREVHVDLSECADGKEMIDALVSASNERQRVADYLSALMPLARLTVPQLRAVAREWQVNVYDCIEKEEIIHRLVIAGGPAS